MNSEHLRREIYAHLQEKIDDLVDSGMSEAEARFQALREFGNAARYAEESREVWRWAWLDLLCQDVRYSVRAMRRDPAFTGIVVLTLALGIGAVTAIFSVVNAVLIQPLPYPHPERLTWISLYNQTFKNEIVSGPDFFDWRSQLHSFDALLGYSRYNSNVVTGADAFQAQTVTVTGDFWEIAGAYPVLGRPFTPGESNVVVLAYSLFERRFGADPRIIGKIVSWGSHPVTIVGVMPRNFRFLFPDPEVTIEPGAAKDADAYMPSGLSPANQIRGTQSAVLRVVGRRKAGVSPAQARAEVEALESRIANQYRNIILPQGILRFNPAGEKLIENSRRPLLVLLAAVGFLLLIACANVANLMLARATARHREISIRAALGAGRGRVIRQLLTESLLLGLVGAAAGMALAQAAIALVARLGPADIPRLREASLDARVFVFALAVSLVTGILFGIGPALASSRASLHDFLKESSRSLSASAAARRLRALLAGVEIALALVLLAGAGLMVKSFWRMNQRPRGFNPDKTLVLKLSTGGLFYGTTPAQIAQIQEALRRLETAPGVEAAGVWNAPLKGLAGVEGVVRPQDSATTTTLHSASSGYLRAMGLRVTQGRWISDNEPEPVVVVNESFAHRVALSENPVGLRVRGRGRIVGVVADLRYSKLDADPEPEIYIPYRQSPALSFVDFVVRTSGDPRAQAAGLRKLISSIDPDHPVYDVQLLEQALSDSIAPRRFNMLLLGIFSGLATLLASVGIYGVMSYAVTQRTREMGVRMALGALPGQVVRMIVKQGATIAALGVLAGLAAALWLTRLMTALLYEVRPWDPATLALVSLTLLSAAVAACWIPARRAARVNPVEALRYE